LKFIRKLYINFSYRSLDTLGARQYFKMLFGFLRNIPSIIRTKNLKIMDSQFSNQPVLSYRDVFGNGLKINPQMNDTAIENDSAILGQVREMVIKNCYFKYFDFEKNKRFATVVDLGANRALFSLMMSGISDHVYLVESNSNYNSVIDANFKMNNRTNYTRTNHFIGSLGIHFKPELDHISFSNWVEKSGIDKIELLKIDIEGSEFSIFKEGFDWKNVKYITMEVHPDCGNPKEIVEILVNCDFKVRAADSLLLEIENIEQADYLFAVNQNWN